ncbi:hypothetical protein ABPG77_007244 [Micractinium sp. CCAP 211/92]
MQGWDAPLQSLLALGTLEGYALLDHRSGGCLFTCGSLQELWGDDQRPSSACRDLWALFHTTTTQDHMDLCGQRALVVQRSDSSVYAVSRGKQVGITAHYLPSGILVTASRRPQWLQVVAPKVEAVCDQLRQP